MSSTPETIDPSDAVMSAFTSAFASVAKVKELEARLHELEGERDTHKAHADDALSTLNSVYDRNAELAARISALEASLDAATKSKEDMEARFSLLRDTINGVVSQANSAMDLVTEPSPTVAQLQPSDVKIAGVDNEVTFDSTAVSVSPDPTTPSSASVDGPAPNADAPTVTPATMDGSPDPEVSVTPSPTPFPSSVSSTDDPLATVSSLSEGDAAPPSATASSPDNSWRSFAESLR